jgi:choline dehydrogenase-like flavoprotein
MISRAGSNRRGFRPCPLLRPVTNTGMSFVGAMRVGTNAWARSHDVRDLFIVEGSIFITSAGVNPMHTIQALALYIADQIKQRLDTLFGC